ncbi:phosphotransferase family protein [Yoonia sediminilitoris]|uniref:Aminoglycoside phosphotransferase (APT) family kinase protein n=1 Tax=Yoonia sediminilitoris TaxID=1286148 RepID=A0A2T6K679_9RHOB|nr:phosphotransferase family protein [Yoonia sediminilitoris]PUB10151.1 aminoglycoside phosphotransferase (APT) family kinase protein [Yoonia sediminilitoris]RCW89673.1 aminoglycoside phosphotransferase (APT) family kinase protein [Yoonia sediminilitoris]
MTQDTQTLDLQAVTAYLAKHLPDFEGPLEATKFQVGQSNPTFLLETPTHKYVLRRKPPGVLLKSAHAVDREFRVQKALAGTDVPVAKMHLLCQDPDVIGSDFYIMDFVAGRNFNEPTLDALTVAERGQVMDDWNRVLAALHDVDIDAVGLSDYGPPGNYFARQIGRWTKQYQAAATETLPAMDKLMAAMETHFPGDDGQRTLVHGDFRIDNMMFEKDGTKCVAVLDWELSTIGHPYADLASVIMQWQMPTGPMSRGLDGVDRSALGLPSDDAFVARYCARRGIDKIDNLGFYVAFCFFRMTAILQGVYRRALDGNASDPEGGKRAGELVPIFAQKGLQSLER